ncbi:hypothetical protein [Rhizobium sp. LjRoot254]|uniref:hypothetical protein n=1 Tax=Rhizobium sp. LjRoot254 TaxID=3342297 RepID=UPI003ECEB270
MTPRPVTIEEWRGALGVAIQRLSSISGQQFFHEETLQYDSDCGALDWIGGAFEWDIDHWKLFMAANKPGRGPWLPPNSDALDSMSTTEIYYRLRENIAGENWVDGALVEAFESGVLVRALERLLLGIDDFILTR